MTATFSADVTVEQAQHLLAEHGQWLPVDGEPAASLGDLVDSNSTGPLRLGYGAWRDLLLGVQFLNGKRELITAGGRTVKNVAGYDLTKFMVGQRGVFGRLVSLTTRTYRRPAGAIAVDLPPNPQTLHDLLTTPLRPQWAVLTSTSLRLGYLGDERTLAFYRKQLPSLPGAMLAEQPESRPTRSLEDDMADRQQLWRQPAGGFRAAVPPGRLAEFVRLAELDTIAPGWAADAMFGILVGVCDESRHASLIAAVEKLGGRCRLPASGEPSGSTGRATMHDSELAILRRLKQAFDPDGSLAPLPEKLSHG